MLNRTIAKSPSEKLPEPATTMYFPSDWHATSLPKPLKFAVVTLPPVPKVGSSVAALSSMRVSSSSSDAAARPPIRLRLRGHRGTVPADRRWRPHFGRDAAMTSEMPRA